MKTCLEEALAQQAKVETLQETLAVEKKHAEEADQKCNQLEETIHQLNEELDTVRALVCRRCHIENSC